MKYKIKLITGFRKDQEYSIDADEAHKAYFLFMHPEARAVFSNGLAIIGSEIRKIDPDYVGTMEWNPTHVLDNDDWNELRTLGVDRNLRNYLTLGKEIAHICDTKDLQVPLLDLVKEKYPLLAEKNSKREGTMKAIGEIPR